MSGNLREDAQRTCTECGAVAPTTRTKYTLIGAEHGWRIHRRTDASGRQILEWLCPTCWNRYKLTRGG